MMCNVRSNRIIGLTGGIASGKSTVSNILKALGAIIIDADAISHELTSIGCKGWVAILEEFGKEFLLANGDINRKKLGETVFANSTELAKLNAITHPMIAKEINDRISNIRNKGLINTIIVDAPLLIEVGLHTMVDEVWLIAIDRNIQIDRLMKRNGLSNEQALNRINSQTSELEKMKYADKVINNSKGLEWTRRQVEKLWCSL